VRRRTEILKHNRVLWLDLRDSFKASSLLEAIDLLTNVRICRISLAFILSGSTITALADGSGQWRFEEDKLVITVVGKDLEFDDARSYQVVVSDDSRTLARLEVNRDAILVHAWITDLDTDGAFEIVVATGQHDGANGSAVDIHEWSPYRLASTQTPRLSGVAEDGYQGYDQFSVTDGRLQRSYPIFQLQDGILVPSGAMRLFDYNVAENVWSVKLVKDR
jgi:hypothetical protein